MSSRSIDVVAALAPAVLVAALQPAAAATSAGDPPPPGHRNVIVLTGYWPPSNEMLRPFSASPELNPDGWIGANWENRGFDVYAYFPEFADPDCTSCGRGFGDLEVDYQDTSDDFWPIMDGHEPVAIITFSRTNAPLTWEVEQNTFNADSWVNDYSFPFQPTPSPPDDGVPADFLRTSTLPMQSIVDAVNGSGLGLDAFICVSQSAGSFLSGFIAYHGLWYQSIHESPADPARCVAAGHVHVGRLIPWDVAHEATKVTLREVIDHVVGIVGAGPADVNVDGTVDFGDLLSVLGAWGGCPAPPDACPDDVDASGAVGLDDVLAVLSSWTDAP